VENEEFRKLLNDISEDILFWGNCIDLPEDFLNDIHIPNSFQKALTPSISPKQLHQTSFSSYTGY
jgi:hypothetical protein